MSFGGGGGGALPNHEHTNIALDGGPLDFVNTTIASLSAGSTTYSNGAALQELVIGNPSDHLVVSAGNIPEWAAATGGTGANVESHITSNFTTTSASATVLTGVEIDLPTISGGKCYIGFSCVANRSGNGGFQNYLSTDTGGSDAVIVGSGRGAEEANAGGTRWNLASQAIHDADNSTIKVFCWTGGNTLQFYGAADGELSTSLCAIGA